MENKDKFESEKEVTDFNRERKFYEAVKTQEVHHDTTNKTYDSVLYRSLPAVKLGKSFLFFTVNCYCNKLLHCRSTDCSVLVVLQDPIIQVHEIVLSP